MDHEYDTLVNSVMTSNATCYIYMEFFSQYELKYTH